MKPDSSRIQPKRPTRASASLRVSASGSKGGDSFKAKPSAEVKASSEKSSAKAEPSFEAEPTLEKILTSAESSLKLGPHGLDPLRRLLGDSSAKHLGAYFAKAALLVVTVYLLSFAVPKMPAPFLALFWAFFTLASTAGVMYQVVVRKTHRQFKYASGGLFARVNNGRIFSFIVSFCVSAACMASLFLESPKWDIAEWVLIFAAVVVYPVVLLLMRRYARREYEPAFQASGEFLWSCAIVGLLLCVAYGAYCAMSPSFGQPVETVLDAFAKTPMPFENSPSALMWNAGVGSWIVDSLTSYGLMQASKVSVPVCFAIRTALCAGAFFGMANLIGLCALPVQELRKIFVSVDAIKRDDATQPIWWRYVVMAAVLPVALVAGFFWGEMKVGMAMQTENGTALQEIARELAGKSVYSIDGALYDQAKIDALASSLSADEANLRTMSSQLKDSLESSYATCSGRTDAFLDWYFSITTNSSLRASIPEGGAQQALEDRFYSLVGSNEDEQLTQSMKNYLAAAANLRSAIDDGMQAAKVDGDVSQAGGDGRKLPAWLVEAKEFGDAWLLKGYREEADGVLDAARDSGISAALDDGKTLLQYQFEKNVYSDAQFSSMASSVDKLSNGGGNIALDVLTYAGGVFDEGMSRDKYRKTLQAGISACEDQTKTLLTPNVPSAFSAER